MMKMKWLKRGLPLLLMTTAYQALAIPPEEREALVALYESTNGDNWKNNTGWLLNEGAECLWRGVGCDSEQLNVISINLFNNNLAGNIPPEIGQLIRLAGLYLQDNQLMGKIPPEITQLSRLAISGTVIPGLSVPGNMPPQPLIPEAKLKLINNCLTTTDPKVVNFLDSVNGWGSNWNNQRADCPITADHAIAVYDDKTGVLVIKDVEVDSQHYTVDLHNQGRYLFTLSSVVVLAEGTYSPPVVSGAETYYPVRSSAMYDKEAQVVSIPSVLVLNKLYTVKLKQNDMGLFIVTDVSEK